MQPLFWRLFFVSLLLWGACAQAMHTQAVHAQAWRVVLLSDINGSYGSVKYPAELTQVMRRILQEWKPDLVLSAGDLVAGQSRQLSRAQLQAMWQGFEREVRHPLSQAGIPFAFTLGNHDAGLPLDREEAARYWAQHPPKLRYLERTAFPFRYSFVAGPLFVAVIDASGPSVSTAQRVWLSQELARPQAKAAPFRLVVGHLPLAAISADKNKRGEVIGEAAALTRVLQQGKVTAYVSGHHAAYYLGRLEPASFEQAQAAGLPPLNVLASGGIGGRDYIGWPNTARSVVSVLEVQQGRIQVTSYDAQTGALIDPLKLPPHLEGLGGPVVRQLELR